MSTQLLQGQFISTGNPVFIPLRFDPDWMYVHEVVSAKNAANTFFWQRGFDKDSYLSNGSTFATTNGFSLQEEHDNQISAGAVETFTGQIGNQNPPRLSLTASTGLARGDIIRMLSNPGMSQLGGLDFEIGNLTGSSSPFTVDLAFAPQVAATTSDHSIKFVKLNRDSIYYPRTRYIASIKTSTVTGYTASTEISFTVKHGFVKGQVIRLNVPKEFTSGTPVPDYTQKLVEVINVPAYSNTGTTYSNSVIVDLPADSTRTAFSYPATTATYVQPPTAVAYRSTQEQPLASTLPGRSFNTLEIGMHLGTSVVGASGSTSYWRAGTALKVLN